MWIEGSTFRLKPDKSSTKSNAVGNWYKKLKNYLSSFPFFFFFPVIKPAFIILVLFCISQFRASEKEKMTIQENYLIHYTSFKDLRQTFTQLFFLFWNLDLYWVTLDGSILKSGFRIPLPIVFLSQYSFKNQAFNNKHE